MASGSESTPLLRERQDTSLLANTRGLPHFEFFLLLCAIYSGVILAALDATVVSTLMAHIGSDLKALDNISWVATGYTVSYSAFQPLYGKLSDIFGRKKIMVFSTLVFGLGCQICGMAGGLPVLVLGRFISGIGAGGMLSTSTITVSDYVPLRSRGVFQGIGNIAFGTGASMGGIFGSWATGIGGWRYAFTLQVPLTLLALVVIIWKVTDKKADENEVVSNTHADHIVKRNSFERIDFVGSISLVATLMLFMFGVTSGGQFGWKSPTIVGSFAGSIAWGAFFYYWEVNRAVEPVLPIEILMHRTVISACLTNFFCSAMCFGVLYYSPVVLTALFNYSYTVLGHRLIANFFGVALGSVGSGIYMKRTGRYYKLNLLSIVLMIIAIAMFLVLPSARESFGKSAIYQSLAYFVNGLGYAIMLTVSLIALIAAVPPESQATSTSAQYTFRGAGSSVGIAIAAAVFQHTLVKSLHQNVTGKHADKIIDAVSRSVEAIREMPKKYQPGIIESYAQAAHAVFLLGLSLSVFAAIAAAYTEEFSLERKGPAEAVDSVPVDEGAV